MRLRLEQRSPEQREDETRGLVVAERRERDRRRVPLPSTPSRPAFEELRPCRAHDEERHAVDPVDEPVDEVEQAVVRPVDVLEDEHRRTAESEHLEEPAPGCERLTTSIPGGRIVASEPDERPQVPLDPRALALVRDVRDCFREPRLGDVGWIRLEDPGLRLHDLAERPERDAFAVGERASLAPGDELLVRVHDAAELEEEPALPHPRYADERHELRRTVAARTLERVREEIELAISPDEGCAPRSAEIHAEPRSCLHGFPHAHWVDLALRLDRV